MCNTFEGSNCLAAIMFSWTGVGLNGLDDAETKMVKRKMIALKESGWTILRLDRRGE